MALFLVDHKHTAETCPTKSRDMMMMLGKHVMPTTAEEYGIKIHSDVVLPGEHHLMMVLEAASQEPVDKYMTPFSMVGTVDVREVKTCEEVVETGNC